MNVLDIGPIIGFLEGRSIFEWLLLENNVRYAYSRTETDIKNVKAGEIFLPPGIIYIAES